MRLDKFLAETWVGQRKQVRYYIKNGYVMVNGIVQLEPSFEVDDQRDHITYRGEQVFHTGKKYYMFHKPKGCITARKDEMHKTVLDYFSEEEQAGLFPVGRLDKDTEGLLLLTNDGEFDYRLMNPNCHVPKTYYFWALGNITKEEKSRLEMGVCIEKEEKLTSPATLVIDRQGYYDEFSMEIDGVPENLSDKKELLKEKVYRKPVVSGFLTITEGKKHQVKRMLRTVGCYVIYLKRISIGELSLDDTLAKGEYRYLTDEEVKLLMK